MITVRLPRRKALLLVLTVALLIHVVFLWQIDHLPRKETGDQEDYIGYARSLLEDHVFVNDGLYSLRPPLYSFLLTPLLAIAGNQIYLAVFVLQIAMNLASTVLVFLIVEHIFASSPAFLAAFAFALYPEFPFYAMQALNVVFSIFLLLAFMLLFASAASGQLTPRQAILAGIIAGLSILCDSKFLFVTIIASIYYIIAERHAINRLWQPLSILVFSTAFVILPWTARNYFLHGSPILVSVNGAYNAYAAYNEFSPSVDSPNVPQLAAKLNVLGKTEAGVNSLGFQLAVAYIIAHPLDTLRLMGIKFLLFFDPRLQGDGILGIAYAFAELGGFAALFIGFGKKNLSRELFFLYIPIVSILIVNVGFQVYSRFRVPAIPFYLILSALAIWFLLGRPCFVTPIGSGNVPCDSQLVAES